MVSTAKKIWHWGFSLMDRYTALRYIFSGGSSALVNLAILSVCTYYFHIYYLYSQAVAFVISFFVSFILQKVVTFRVASLERVFQEVNFFVLITVINNLIFNSVLMYVFVDHLSVNVILAQIFSGIIVAFIGFFLYKEVVFKNKNL